MKNILRTEILKLKNLKHVDKQVLAKHLEFLENEEFFTRPQNPFHHFGVFFLPINVSTKSIYLGNHIKAGGWIPPGGHLEEKEAPRFAAIRECQEELSHQPKQEEIELFDLSITQIHEKRSFPCRTHFDIWYLVHTEKLDFVFDKREFHEAGWFEIDQAIKMMMRGEQRTVVEQLKIRLNHYVKSKQGEL